MRVDTESKKENRERIPIVLSKNDIALIQMFQKTDDMLDIGMDAMSSFIFKETAERAAKQFISQLKGRATPRFMRALRDEINEILEDSGTERLINN